MLDQLLVKQRLKQPACYILYSERTCYYSAKSNIFPYFPHQKTGTMNGNETGKLQNKGFTMGIGLLLSKGVHTL